MFRQREGWLKQLHTAAEQTDIAKSLALWRATGRPGFGSCLSHRLRQRAILAAEDGEINTLDCCLKAGLILSEAAEAILQAALSHNRRTVLRWLAAHSGGLSEPFLSGK